MILSPKEQTQPQLEHPDTGCRTQRTPTSQPEQEKHRKKKREGKGCQSTYATWVAEGQAPGDRKGRKSPSEPAAGEAAQTVGPGRIARHKVENQATHHRHLQPNNKAPPQEKDSKLEPERLQNPLRVSCGRGSGAGTR